MARQVKYDSIGMWWISVIVHLHIILLQEMAPDLSRENSTHGSDASWRLLIYPPSVTGCGLEVGTGPRLRWSQYRATLP